MSFNWGFDFRSTSGFVSDPANCSPVLGEAYPHTYGNGAVAGWESGPGGERDRSASLDARLAGINFDTVAAHVFRVDLLAAASTDIHCALGDTVFSNAGGQWDFKDGTTVLFTQNATVTTKWRDANGNDWSDAAWPGSEVKNTQTFSTTIFRLVTSGTSGFWSVAHLRLVQAAAAGGLFRPAQLSGLDTGGPFFGNPLNCLRQEIGKWSRAVRHLSWRDNPCFSPA